MPLFILSVYLQIKGLVYSYTMKKTNIGIRLSIVSVLVWVMGSLTLSAQSLTAHTTTEYDAYLDANTSSAMSVTTYSERQYEVYGFFKGKDSGGDVYGVAAIGDGEFFPIATGTSNSNATYLSSWLSAGVSKLSSSQSGGYGAEFPAKSDKMYQSGGVDLYAFNGKDVVFEYAQLKGTTIALKVKGYDQIAITEQSVKSVSKGRYFSVKINGVEATNTDGVVSATGINRFTLDPTIESTVTIEDAAGTSNNSNLGAFFSLRRIPQVVQAATMTVGANTYTADVVNTTDVHFTLSYADYMAYVTSLTPTINLITGGAYQTASDQTTPKDFSTPQNYVFTYDGKTYPYTVTVEHVAAATANDVTKFDYTYTLGSATTRSATISGNTIKVTLPYSMQAGKVNAALANSVNVNMEYSNLAVATSLSSGLTNSAATYSASGNVNLSTSNAPANQITITSEAGVAKTYDVTVDYDAPKTGKNILSFVFKDGADTLKQTSVFKEDETGASIEITIGADEDIDELTPSIVCSEMATINPASGVEKDFTNPLTYTVTAENGDSKQYKVTVKQDGTAPTITFVKPWEGDTTVILKGKIRIKFDEPVVTNGTTATAVLKTTGSSEYNQDIKATVKITSDTTAEFVYEGLKTLTNYTFTIEKNFFADLYGNKTSEAVLHFRTSDDTLHTKHLDYVTNMDGAEFERPSFIQGVEYNEDVVTMASSTNLSGAYEIQPGEQMVIKVESDCVMDVIAWATTNVTFTINGTTYTTNDNSQVYDNDGVEISNISISAKSTVTIDNISAETMYIPYISFGKSNITDEDAHCQTNN